MSQWLNAEALAQYIVGALTTVLIILGWWLFKRKRARCILVEPVSDLSLLSIHPAIRDRITVILDKQVEGGEQIERLSQLRVKIHNTTRETIEKVVLRFFFKPPIARLLDVKLDPPEEMLWQDDPPHYQLESESQVLAVSLPYLKSSDVYGEEQNVILTLLADGGPHIDRVVGGGADGTAQYLSYEDRLEQIERRQRFIAAMSVSVFLTFCIITIWTFYAQLSGVFSSAPGLYFIFGLIIGFTLAYAVGFISSRILWHWGRIKAIRRPV